MKNLFFLLGMVITFSLNAQDQQDNTFNRKGRLMIETGYAIASGSLPGSGITVLADENSTLSTIGFDGGYMISENFALKGRLSFTDLDGFSINSFGLGAKYYISGVLPVEIGFSNFSVSGDSEQLINASVGYAIRLADNINLEPSVGILTSTEGGGNFTGKMNFVFFL